jgi:hypothetical protein
VTSEELTVELDVITPSYAPDFELCRDLNASVLRHGGPEGRHTIIVPPRDLALFAPLQGERTSVRSTSDYLRGLYRLPRNLWFNPHRPWVPVRGWIAQQVVKLEAAARSTAAMVVMVDSDIVFVRDFGPDTFRAADGAPEFYRCDGAIDDTLPRHVIWHAVARRLLGLEPRSGLPLDDYVCCPCGWEPAVVRSMLAEVEARAGASWQRVVAAQLHFSEMILYGVYVDARLPADGARRVVADMRCHRHYDEVPLDESDLREFLAGIRPVDHSVMISAKSGTALAARRAALAEVAELR